MAGRDEPIAVSCPLPKPGSETKETTMSTIAERGYAKPDALVDTEWVAQHLQDPGVRIVESNEDPLLYPAGHIPGAVQIDWAADLNDPLRRDYLDRQRFEQLMARNGISNSTTVVFY